MFDRILLFLMFLMMCSITVGQNPLLKIADGLTTKYKRQAQADSCNRLVAMKDVYENFARQEFDAGCTWDVIQLNWMIINASKDKKERTLKFQKELEDKESKFYEDADKHCSEGAAAYFMDGRIQELIVKDLYDKLKCEEVLDIM
jgi:hypothetical protein